jgi:hypothetical protein
VSLHARFLVGLFFNPKDGGAILVRKSIDFQRTTRRYIPEGRTLHDVLLNQAGDT